jgi:tetratricopeptide (TPR) repeat protein
LTAEAGNRPGEAKAMYGLALAFETVGDVPGAVEMAERCLTTAREIEARPVEADALNLLGSIRIHQGDFAAAQLSFADALELQRANGNRSGAADAMNNLALVQMWSGDFVAAVDTFSEVRALYNDLEKPQMEAAAVMNLGRIDAARGDLNRARSRFEEAAGLFRAQGLTEGLGDALFGLGEVLLTQGDLPAARARHEEAASLRREAGLGTEVESRFALAGLTLAEAAVGRRSYDEAVDELTRAVQELQEGGRPALEADAVNYLVEAELGAGNTRLARVHLDRLDELASSSNPVTLMVRDINRARLSGVEGRHEEAVALLETVIESAGDEGILGVELEARLALAEELAGAGRTDDARVRLADVRREAIARGWMHVADRAAVLEQRLENR